MRKPTFRAKVSHQPRWKLIFTSCPSHSLSLIMWVINCQFRWKRNSKDGTCRAVEPHLGFSRLGTSFSKIMGESHTKVFSADWPRHCGFLRQMEAAKSPCGLTGRTLVASHFSLSFFLPRVSLVIGQYDFRLATFSQPIESASMLFLPLAQIGPNLGQMLGFGL